MQRAHVRLPNRRGRQSHSAVSAASQMGDSIISHDTKRATGRLWALPHTAAGAGGTSQRAHAAAATERNRGGGERRMSSSKIQNDLFGPAQPTWGGGARLNSAAQGERAPITLAAAASPAAAA